MLRRVALLLIVLSSFPVAGRAAETPPSAARLILEPASGTIFTIEGRYPRKPGVCESKQRKPLRAKYRGRIELVRSSDGSIRMINRLSFPHYLNGLAEVPPSWPDAALRAQVIAARSYALDALRRTNATGYDICATDQCQVYRGATVELGAFGERWVRAVNATPGQVLQYRGRVIQTFYFSTSDGRTRRSFPGGTPQPYYPSVDGEDDDAPLADWVVPITLRDLTAVLKSRGEWTGGQITGVSQSGDNVRLSDGGSSRTFSRADVRIALNNDAPCLYPTRYPPEDEGRKLPQTLPSANYSVKAAGGRATFRGKGWGHGVGMSQWGARSLAERGRSTAQILSHYYGPARITRVAEPGAIRVLAAEDMQSVRIAADGEFRARTDTGSVLAPSKRFEVRGGKALRIYRGRGPTLKAVLTITPDVTRVDATAGSTEVTIGFAIPKNARVSAILSRGDQTVQQVPERSFELGDNKITLPLRDLSSVALEPGEYQAVVRAYDGLDRVRSVPVAVVIPAAAQPSPAASDGSADSGRSIVLVAVAAVLLLSALLGAFVRRRRPSAEGDGINA